MRRALLVLLVALGACSASPSDAPPPPRKPELVHAPPNSRGARAAGTDAAPQPELGLPLLGNDGAPPSAPTEPPPDAGAPASPATPPAPGSPDAGTAL